MPDSTRGRRSASGGVPAAAAGGSDGGAGSGIHVWVVPSADSDSESEVTTSSRCRRVVWDSSVDKGDGKTLGKGKASVKGKRMVKSAVRMVRSSSVVDQQVGDVVVEPYSEEVSAVVEAPVDLLSGSHGGHGHGGGLAADSSGRCSFCCRGAFGWSACCPSLGFRGRNTACRSLAPSVQRWIGVWRRPSRLLTPRLASLLLPFS